MNNKLKYELLGFIQGDGTLTDLNNPSKHGININVGVDDEDVNSHFNFNRPIGERAIYYNYNDEVLSLLHSLQFDIKTLPERCLPLTFKNWSYEDKLNFMRGLYSANGSVLEKYNRITFKTTCRELAEQIKQFWTDCGLNPYITTNKSKTVKFSNGEYTCKESYDVNMTRLENRIWFRDNIGFIQNYKNDKLNNSINNQLNKRK